MGRGKGGFKGGMFGEVRRRLVQKKAGKIKRAMKGKRRIQVFLCVGNGATGRQDRGYGASERDLELRSFSRKKKG